VGGPISADMWGDTKMTSSLLALPRNQIAKQRKRYIDSHESEDASSTSIQYQVTFLISRMDSSGLSFVQCASICPIVTLYVHLYGRYLQIDT
jgi:hypothetical protein